MQNRKLDLPNEDKRWRIIGATMRKHGFQADALIETLHAVQTAFGYLDDQSLRWVSQNLRVPLSRVYGVATFYNYFSMKPQGAHTCVVCLGTACYIKGAPQLLKTLQETEGIKAGETSTDKQVSLLVARCIGACGLAPAVVYDGEVAGKQAPDDLMNHLQAWREGAHVAG